MSTELQQGTAGELLQLVTFSIGSEEFGVDILSVQEIIRHTGITKVPSAPPCVEGVLNLRGKVIPIVDMRRRFGMEPKQADNNTRIVVFTMGTGVMGLLVDSVSEVLRIPAAKVEAPPAITASVDAQCIRGVGKLDERLLLLLDAARVLSLDEAASLQLH